MILPAHFGSVGEMHIGDISGRGSPDVRELFPLFPPVTEMLSLGLLIESARKGEESESSKAAKRPDSKYISESDGPSVGRRGDR